MIIVEIPRDNNDEREYIVDVILGEFLGLDYIVNVKDILEYRMILENGKKLILKDGFFSSHLKVLEYLNEENIPSNIQFCKNKFIVEKDIPVIFGVDTLETTDTKIICGLDIFASSFFMLTRWEEYVNKKRDMHNRFPATASLAYKCDFLGRPVVNEYVEMLWNMLEHLGINQKRKKREYRFILTHDVDHIYYWKNIKQLVHLFGGDVLKRKDLNLALNHVIDFSYVKLGKRKDPYDTFDWIMDLSEELGIVSRFYFMSGGVTQFDNNYGIGEPRSLEIIKKIRERSHTIGFHPSYNSYNNPVQWSNEKAKLEEVTGFSVREGRQHYLRFEAPLTWQIWEDNGIDMDCTLSYADKEGFRCGTCYEFSVYNFLKRKKLALKEYPLTVMEGSITISHDITPKKMEVRTRKLLDKVKKYKGNFVYLWHNSSFNTWKWSPYSQIYMNIIREGSI